MENRDIEFMEGEEAPPRGAKIAGTLRWIAFALAMLTAVGTLTMALGGFGPAASAESMYHCPMHPTVVSDRPSDCPICGMDLVPIGEGGGDHDHHHGHGDEEEELRALAERLGAEEGQWICPMESCQHVADEDGTCPVCGMALVPVPGEGGTKRRRVEGLIDLTISPERVARIGVKTAPVVEGSLSTTVRTVGVVQPAEDRLHKVQARFSGWVEEVYVAEVGAVVEAGQPLLSVFSPELYQAQLDFLNARQWGGAMLRSARRRLELLGISATEIARVEKRGAPLETLVLRAPAKGHVIEKDITPGARISPETTLYAIADLSRVWLHADLFSRDLGRVAPGAKASFVSQDGVRVEGEVALVHPTLDPRTRTAKARILLENPDLRLRPGMFGDVRLEAERFVAPLVPRDALIETGEHSYVLVARRGGHFSPREVEVLGRSGDQVALEGVDPGEMVVTSGGFFIDSESRLRSALLGMGSGSGDGGHDDD